MIRWITSLAISSVAIPVSLLRLAVSPLQSTPNNDLKSNKTMTQNDRDQKNPSSSSETVVGVTVAPTRSDISIGEKVKQPGEFMRLKHGNTHYFLKGPVDGPLVVLLHGVSVFSFVWNRLADLLVHRGFRVLTFDFYGHGYTDVPDVKYNIDLFREQFEELMEQLGLFKQYDSLILMGHSMGGLVASEFTAKHKDLVKKVILFNSAGLPVSLSISNPLPLVLNNLVKIFRTTKVFDFAAHKLADILSFAANKTSLSYEDICKAALQLDEDIKTERTWISGMVSNAAKSVINEGNLRFARALTFLYQCWVHQAAINTTRAVVLLSVIRDCPLLDANHSETLKRIQKHTPVLIIWGEEDGILPHSLIHDFKSFVPHAEILSIPQSDHAAFLQKPSLVFGSIMRFINSSEQKGEVVVEQSVDTQVKVTNDTIIHVDLPNNGTVIIEKKVEMEVTTSTVLLEATV
jgi:pimeloyl-ACP methyl ester carboxylesterase